MKYALKILYQHWRSIMQSPRRVFVLPREIYSFRRDLARFRADPALRSDEKIELHPIFYQRNVPSSFDAHYVYQAAWAIRRIAAGRPAEHHDISSNIPYVAALSAIVPVRFCEYRPPDLRLPGLSTEHVDIAALPFASDSVASLSCLHVLEHVGLGRYGDPVSAGAFAQACREIGRVAAPGASVFLSIPIGRERVCFNMHRVSDPARLPQLMGPQFQLKEFSVVTDDRRYLEHVNPADFTSQSYACGLYWFVKAT